MAEYGSEMEQQKPIAGEIRTDGYHQLEALQGGWVLQAEGSSRAACPLCGVISLSRHSRYWRTIKDLPMLGTPVTIHVQLGRWRCRNMPVSDDRILQQLGCDRKVFFEAVARGGNR